MKNYSRYSCKYWICFYVELFILVFLPYLALFILMWSNYSCLLDCCLSFPMIWATSYNLETLWCNLLSAEFERLENPTPQGCHNSHATFKSPFPDISYINVYVISFLPLHFHWQIVKICSICVLYLYTIWLKFWIE